MKICLRTLAKELQATDRRARTPPYFLYLLLVPHEPPGYVGLLFKGRALDLLEVVAEAFPDLLARSRLGAGFRDSTFGTAPCQVEWVTKRISIRAQLSPVWQRSGDSSRADLTPVPREP